MIIAIIPWKKEIRSLHKTAYLLLNPHAHHRIKFSDLTDAEVDEIGRRLSEDGDDVESGELSYCGHGQNLRIVFTLDFAFSSTRQRRSFGITIPQSIAISARIGSTSRTWGSPKTSQTSATGCILHLSLTMVITPILERMSCSVDLDLRALILHTLCPGISTLPPL